MPNLIQFESTDKLLLPGLLYEPAKKTKKVAIYLHGNGGSSIFYNALRSNILAEQLNNKNIAFFPFNNRGGELIKSLKNKKEQRTLQGSGLELIKDCLKDIDGAITYLKNLGYTDFYLIGHSTGANKAALYNFYKPKNQIAKFILTGPGDDTGWYYKLLGPKAFSELLDESKRQIKISNGEKLSSQALKFNEYMSFQSLYDVMNPDGDYNTYPFYEYKNNLDLSQKKLFREFSSIDQPTLVIYGSEDEYCEGAGKAIEILKQQTKKPKLFDFELIKGSDHSFHGYEKELAKIIANWLDK